MKDKNFEKDINVPSKQIIIDGVDVKDCKRRIGKDNFCRYYKRPCAENNYNCIWKKYLRKEQECEELKEEVSLLKESNFKLQQTEDGKSIEKFYLQQLKQAEQKLEKIKEFLIKNVCLEDESCLFCDNQDCINKDVMKIIEGKDNG